MSKANLDQILVRGQNEPNKLKLQRMFEFGAGIPPNFEVYRRFVSIGAFTKYVVQEYNKRGKRYDNSYFLGPPNSWGARP